MRSLPDTIINSPTSKKISESLGSFRKLFFDMKMIKYAQKQGVMKEHSASTSLSAVAT